MSHDRAPHFVTKSITWRESQNNFGITRYTKLHLVRGLRRCIGYRQSMLQHAKDLEGFAPQTHDQGSTLDGIKKLPHPPHFFEGAPSPVGRNRMHSIQCQEGSGAVWLSI